MVIQLDPVVEQAELEKVVTTKKPATKILTSNLKSNLSIEIPLLEDETSELLHQVPQIEVAVEKMITSEDKTERRNFQSEQKHVTNDTFESYQFDPNCKVDINTFDNEDTVQYEDLAEQIINVKVTKTIE